MLMWPVGALNYICGQSITNMMVFHSAHPQFANYKVIYEDIPQNDVGNSFRPTYTHVYLHIR